MSIATNLSTQSPTSRFEGGFDRWDADALNGRAVLWRGSERGRYILGNGPSVWMWDQQVRSWKRLAPEQEALALRDHSRALNRLRRALLTARSLESPLETERAAARMALQRIGAAIVREWRLSVPSDDASWTAGWLDHPAAIYVAATQHCRLHFPEQQQLPFDAKLFASLVASAQEDYAAGRRPQPPRLRPEDMMLLQTNVDTAKPVAPPQDTDFIQRVREELPDQILREEERAIARKRWRHAMVMGLAGLALGAAAAVTTFVGMS